MNKQDEGLTITDMIRAETEEYERKMWAYADMIRRCEEKEEATDD